jgi:outer membrane protein
MNRIRTIAPLIIIFILLVAGVTYAQQTSKIAIINSQKAFETSIEGKKALGQLQALDAKIKTDIAKMEDAIRLLENRLNTGRLTMTNDALMGIQADIDKKTTERKRYEEDQTREAQLLSQNLIQKIRGEMVAVIETLAKERGLELVLDAANSGVVTAAPTVDITDEVVKRYDATKTAGVPAPPIKK